MIPIYKPYLGIAENTYIQDCINSTWISSKGEYVDRFKEHIKNYLDCKYVVLTHNGSVPLMLALAAANLGVGDEICVPSLTYVATISQPVWLGLKVRLFDSLPNAQPDIDSLLKVMSPQTKAVILPTLYGNAPDIEKFLTVCKANDIFLLEDAAENFGSKFKGRAIGTWGDAGTYSFFGNKTITTGEGGCVVTNNKDLYERMELLNNQSHLSNFVHEGPGFNFRMTNMQAAIGCAQMEKIEEIAKLKSFIAEFYKKALPNNYIYESPDVDSAYWMPLFKFNGQMTYTHFRERLIQQGVDTRPCFSPCHLAPGFGMCEFDSLPVCEDVYSDCFNLPCYPGLEMSELEYIASSVIQTLEI